MRLLGVARSHRRDKKLAATFGDGRGRTVTVHFGARPYADYTTYYRASPALARRRRALYIRRHGAAEAWTDPLAPGTLSRYILWEHPTVPRAVAEYRRRFGV